MTALEELVKVCACLLVLVYCRTWTDSTQKSNASLLVDLVQDASRFIRYFKWPIENSPLQLYASALLFSPVKILTRRNFEPEKPDWISLTGPINEEWGPCLQTLEGHLKSVTSLTYCPEGKLASGSLDDTIRI